MPSRSRTCLLCLFLVLVAGAIFFSISFYQPTQSHTIPSRPGTLSAGQAWALLQNGEIKVIDIRRSEEWQQTGTPRKSLRLSFEQHPDGSQGFLRDLELALDGDKTKPFAIICRTGNRTGTLLPFLHAHGFSGAMDIPEGIAGSSHGKGWLRNDLPLDR
ncbi:Rhodanese-related sulfurtransferase [Desulfonatronum thiosulfatophilum]|uniref:Rhodanese-related sulfurtransferase n=1 Tax=Desulfonatronum thiosulfatophilum TaxID=617002 RepID=A0A1G6D2F9_9BACT|nr:rhodanese-like domain-containing protein [Desulfonatronum thiosulfatophilum]SDB39300.1 Rhodanese-related sulfurtransferase [Desulfonatronum thiosulfatophilum]